MMDFAKRVDAFIHHTGDDEYCLQIELGNDRAILFTCREGETPRITLWRGSGECDFSHYDIDSFREFVAEAFEPREAAR
jgi:hypothetical protein